MGWESDTFRRRKNASVTSSPGGMKAKKISRTRLAEELGMAKSTLSQRFSGVTEFKLFELIAICDLFGIKIEIGE